MLGQARARRWLTLDAGYCAGAGALAVALSGPLARLYHVPAGVLLAVGAATLVWACALVVIARREAWRGPLRAIATANLLAAAGIAALAVVSPVTAGRVLLAAVAVEVAAFAVAEFRVLR